MDTLKILLAATVALLLAAIGLSWKNMDGHSGGSAETTTTQQLELEKVKLEQTRLQLQVLQLSQKGGVTASSTGANLPSTGTSFGNYDSSATGADAASAMTPSDIAASKAKIEEMEAQKKKLAQASGEESSFIEGMKAPKAGSEKVAADRVSRRMALIRNSGVMARISEWAENPGTGSFAVLEIVSPDNVQAGTELLIRRNGGVLGRLRVEEVQPDGTLANPITAFDTIKPVKGDELILPPQFMPDDDGH